MCSSRCGRCSERVRLRTLPNTASPSPFVAVAAITAALLIKADVTSLSQNAQTKIHSAV